MKTERSKFSWEKFQYFEIVRTKGIAEIIIARFQARPDSEMCKYNGRPVRLLGFTTDATLTDYEILEDGFAYCQELLDCIES